MYQSIDMENTIWNIFYEVFTEPPKHIERCAVGHGNFVFIVEGAKDKYVIRCSENIGAYTDTIKWLEKLVALGVPVPKIIKNGIYKGYTYLILSYIEGQDIGNVYIQLSDSEKRNIAKNIIHIQDKVATLELNTDKDWQWISFIRYMLERAKTRIAQNYYFDVTKVEQLYGLIEDLEKYFEKIKPIAYLDDISSKNVLIYEGKLNGIIDVDWIGIGDKLTFVALTNMAFLDLGYDSDYVKYLLEEMNISKEQYKAFLFYSLMYCVDFMGERGMIFTDKKVEVSEQVIEKLNGIYELLWNKYKEVSA